MVPQPYGRESGPTGLPFATVQFGAPTRVIISSFPSRGNRFFLMFHHAYHDSTPSWSGHRVPREYPRAFRLNPPIVVPRWLSISVCVHLRTRVVQEVGFEITRL